MVYFVLVVLFILFLLKHKQISVYSIKVKRHLLGFCILFIMIGIIYYSKDTIQISKQSIHLWMENVLPSLFGFLICLELLKQTKILSSLSQLFNPLMKPLFGVSGTGGLALLLGLTSGYPIGALVTTNLYEEGRCNKNEAEKMLAFTNTSGPIFIIGAVGTSMYYDYSVGVKLLISHILAAICVGFLLRKHHISFTTRDIIPQVSIKTNTSSQISLQNLGECIKTAIFNSLKTLSMILGLMVFFSILGGLLSQIGIMSLFSKAISPILMLFHLSENLSVPLFQGIIEMTSGISNLAQEIRIPMLQKMCLTSFLLGFGGVSVHLQVASIVSKAKLSLKPYLLGKIIHGIISGIFTFILFSA